MRWHPTESLEQRSKTYLNVPRDNSEKIIASDMTIVTHNDLYGEYIQIPKRPLSCVLMGIL
jgi:hypothetical protein